MLVNGIFRAHMLMVWIRKWTSQQAKKYIHTPFMQQRIFNYGICVCVENPVWVGKVGVIGSNQDPEVS